MTRLSTLSALAAIVAAGIPTAAICQDVAEESHQFGLRAGTIFSKMSTTVRLDSKNLPGDGTEISFEDDVGLNDRSTVPFVEGSWRFADDWMVAFEYFGIDRTQTAIIDKDIDFGDDVYEVGGEVESRFRSNLYKVQVGWLPVRTSKAEVGLTLGVHLTDFLFGLSGEVTTGEGGTRFAAETRSVLAPLPNFGAFGRVKIADDVSIGGRFNWFSLKIGDYKGGITDAEANVQWKFHKNFGIGGGYRVLNYRLDIDTEDRTGKVRYKIHGPVLFAIASF